MRRAIVRHRGPTALLFGGGGLIAIYAVVLPATMPEVAGNPVALLAVLAAATVSSVVGFAFSPICGAALLHLEADHVQAVRIMAVASIGIQALSVWTLRREIVAQRLLPFLAGGLAALPLGVHLLLTLPMQAYATGLGALLVAYGLWMAFRPPLALPFRPGPIAHALAGATGGITGGVAAFPGALVVIWCGMQGWPKAEQRAVFQPFILAMQVAMLALLQAMGGGAQNGMDPAVLAYLPPALVGTLCGLGLFRRLSDGRFTHAVNALLVVSGLALLL